MHWEAPSHGLLRTVIQIALQLYGEFNWKNGQIELLCSLCPSSNAIRLIYAKCIITNKLC